MNFWDSRIFLAWIKQEACWSDEVTKGIEQEIEQAYTGQLIVATSCVTLTEVLLSRMTKEQKDRYQKLFRHPSLQLLDIDRHVAAKAATIRAATTLA